MAESRKSWSQERLEDLGSFAKGRGGTRADDRSSGIPVVRYGELYTRHHDVVKNFYSFVSPEDADEYTELRKGDLLLAGSGETAEEIGKAAVFLGPEPALAAGDTVIFRPGGSLDPKFLGYAANGRGVVEQKMSLGQGSSVMHIYVRDLRRITLDVPPLAEQQGIAAILSSVDDAIAATRKVIEQAKRVNQGLLQTLLTRGIGHKRFKKTEIGEMPGEWEIVSLGEVAQLQTGPFGSQLKASAYTEEGTPVVMPSNLHRGRIEIDGIARVPRAITERLSKHRLSSGDIVFARRGEIGRSALTDASENGWLCGTGCLRARPSERVHPQFLFLAVSRYSASQWLEANAVGQTMLNLNTSILGGLPLPLPSLKEQERIAETLSDAGSPVELAIAHRDLLEQLKRGLMQDLLSGRVRVPLD